MTAQEGPTFDPVRILQALERHLVDHLVVGGVAAQAYGAARTTSDLDCVPRATTENLERLRVSTWTTDAGPMDVLLDIPDERGVRLGYDDLVPRGEQRDAAGVRVVVASLDDIVQSKRWANRLKDHDALPELESILRQQIEDAES